LAKQLKINIKNTQIAEAINLNSLKNKLSSKKSAEPAESPTPKTDETKSKITSDAQTTSSVTSAPAEEQPRIKARSKSVFEETALSDAKHKIPHAASSEEPALEHLEPTIEEEAKQVKAKTVKKKTSEELRQEIFAEEIAEQEE
jgi:translation initiation factor IF-2